MSTIKGSPLIIVLIALMSIAIYILWPQSAQNTQFNRMATPVKTEIVQRVDLPITIEALGTAQANEAVSITAKEAEVVTAVHFEDGQTVPRGHLLVEQNRREEMARVDELEVDLAEAKRQYNRIMELAREDAASEELVDERKARVDILSAQLNVLSAQAEELSIRAPFSGTLGMRKVSIGSLVRPGDEITTLDDISRIKVDFNLSEVHVPSLAIGQKVFASSAAYPGKEFVGTIASLDSRVDPVTRSIRVRAVIPNEQMQLRPGMLLQVRLQKRVLNTLALSEKALVPNGDQQFVFVVENGQAVQRAVNIGERRPGLVEIKSGLKSGDEVITEGTLRVKDGSSIQVIGSAAATAKPVVEATTPADANEREV